MNHAAMGLALCLASGWAGATSAQDLKATQKFTDTQVAFEPAGPYRNYTLRIAGPDRFHASAVAGSEAPTIDLRRFGPLADGVYNYELTAMSDEKVSIRTPLDDGRPGGASDTAFKSVSTSGIIQIKGGAIVKPSTAQTARKDVR